MLQQFNWFIQQKQFLPVLGTWWVLISDPDKSGDASGEKYASSHWNRAATLWWTCSQTLCVIIFFRVCIIPLPAMNERGPLVSHYRHFAITNSHSSAPDLSSILCSQLWPLISSVWIPRCPTRWPGSTAHQFPCCPSTLRPSSAFV